MRITPDQTIALIIDFQEKLIPVMRNKEKLINNTTKLIQGLKTLEIPLILTEQYPKGLGKTIKPIQKALETYDPIAKTTFSCADNSDIANAIISHNKKNIIICGIEAHICVLQTIIDLRQQGYNIITIEDCIGSRKRSDKETALKRAIQLGAIPSSYESILFELKRIAGDDQFRIISKIIK